MADYQVGNIELVLKTFSSDTIAQLDTITKSIKALRLQLNKINNMDFRKLYNSFSSLTRIITPFVDKLTQAAPALSAFATSIQLTGAYKSLTYSENKLSQIESRSKSIRVESERIKDNTRETRFGLGKIFANLGTLYLVFNYSKRIGRAFANVISSAIDFEETLNKFQVSFGKFSAEATTYVNRMTYAFNTSSEAIMNYMATFNNMLSSLGSIGGAESYALTKTLTQLGIDYASLFNVSVDKAMQQFQSVLSGQIRQIRTTSGIDVSETTIYGLYQSLGGSKTMRQLSQLEKRLLRIYAIEKQMSDLGAVGYVNPETGEILGDYEKTINSAANMAKQLSTVTAEWSKYLGQILVTYVKPLLTYGLAFMITLREITKSFAILNNYVAEEFNQNAMVSLFGDATEAIEETQNALNGLLSFDKFEALSANKSVTDDLSNILDAIVNYESGLDKVSSNATQIAEKILKWLGFTQQVVETTDAYGNTIQDVIWKLDSGFTRLDAIRLVLESIFALVMVKFGTKLILGVRTLVIQMTALNTNLTFTSLILKTISTIGIVAGIVMIIEGLRKGNKALIITGSVLTTILGTLKLIMALNIGSKMAVSFALAVEKLTMRLTVLQSTLVGVGIGMVGISAAAIIFTQMDQWSAKTKVVIGVLTTLIASLTAASVAWLTYHGAMTLGAAVPIIIGATAAGAAGITALIKGVKQFADGGVPKEGSLFIANERGAELVGNIGGQSAVANNDMIVSAIENAAYRGMVKAINIQRGNKDTVEFSFSGATDGAIARALATPMINELRRQGYKVEKI